VVRDETKSEDKQEEWKGEQMWVTEEKKDWLKISLVGRLQHRDELENLQESFILNEVGFIFFKIYRRQCCSNGRKKNKDLTKVVEDSRA